MLSKKEFCYVGTNLVQMGYEILHRVEANGITVELQQNKIFCGKKDPFYGFYIMVWFNKEDYKECECVNVTYERNEAWKMYRKAIGDALLPF